MFAITPGRVERVNAEPTTGMAVSGPGDSALSSIEWANADPAPSTSVLTTRTRSSETERVRVRVREPHSLLWHNGHLHAVSTAENSIVALDANGNVAYRWKAPGHGDCWHLNPLTRFRGRLVASAFGKFGRHREWSEGNNRLGHGIVFEPGTGKTILDGLSCPHDPTFLDGGWLVCNSAERAVVKFSSEGEEIGRLELGGWTRGLAADESSLFVGVSAHRLVGQEGKARVVHIDRSTFATLGEWELPCPEVFALTWVHSELLLGNNLEKSGSLELDTANLQAA